MRAAVYLSGSFPKGKVDDVCVSVYKYIHVYMCEYVCIYRHMCVCTHTHRVPRW